MYGEDRRTQDNVLGEDACWRDPGEGKETPEGGEGAGPEATSGAVSEGRRSLTGDTAPDVAPPSHPPGTKDVVATSPAEEADPAPLPRLGKPRRGRRLVKKGDRKVAPVVPEDRLMILDIWQRSGLPAKDFAPLVGVSPSTLGLWKRRFNDLGPAGLMDRQKGGRRGSHLPEVTKRAILMIKKANPEYGCQRISDMLLRGPALPASASAVGRVLKEAGYEFEEVKTIPHKPVVRRFERDRSGIMWQSDVFSFMLKRQNRRVYLIAFLDDHSRYIVSYGLHASASTALALEVLRAGIVSYGPPEEILTDRGPQYSTWRGKSEFTKELEKQGIKHILSSPRHPQTCGKIERWWKILWTECVESAIFLDLGDARIRIGNFVDWFNFQRPSQAIGGLVPADRFFNAAPEVLKTLKERVAANALEIACNGVTKDPFYVTGYAGGKQFSVHAEGERVYFRPEDGERREIELTAPTDEPAESIPEPIAPQGVPGSREDPELGMEKPPAPGVSPLDEGIRELKRRLESPEFRSDGE